MTAPLRERLLAKIRVDLDGPCLVDEAPCWMWTGGKTGGGYGAIGRGGKGAPMLLAHRAVWQLLRGPIPTGLQIDHLCGVKACVNPAHLEPVTARVNTLRSNGPAARNAAKTHCIRGHEFTPENTYLYGRDRHCKTCGRLKMRAVRARQAVAA